MRFSVLPMGIPRLGCEAIPSTYDRTSDGDMIIVRGRTLKVEPCLGSNAPSPRSARFMRSVRSKMRRR